MRTIDAENGAGRSGPCCPGPAHQVSLGQMGRGSKGGSGAGWQAFMANLNVTIGEIETMMRAVPRELEQLI